MNTKSVLILSVLANIALLGAVGYLAKNRPASGAEPKSTETAPAAAASTVVIPARAANELAPGVVTNREVQVLDWHAVESDDYRKYIVNLRAIGCPEETIRDIIIADVNKMYASRRRAMASGGKKFEFWKTSGNPFESMMDSNKMEQQAELDKEKRALLKQLLGVDPPAEVPNMFAGVFSAMLDFLPDEKQNKVMELMQDMQIKAMKAMKNGADGEDMKEMQKVQKEMETELAKIMTPEEFEQYQLRMSQTAMQMRMQLGSFDPSEDEFRKIFAVKKKFDEEFSMFTMGNEDKADRDKREAAKKETDSQIKAMLGDARYAEYQRAEDYNFQALYRITERNGLGKEVANKVYDMKATAEAQASRLRTDQSMTGQQRDTALLDIRNETESSIRAALGDKGYKSYERQAWWLNNISPKPEADSSSPATHVETILRP